LFVVPVWLRDQLRSRVPKLLDVCVAVQLVLDVHRRLRACSGVSMRFVVRLQFV
jgi:hypothetical protein